MLRWKLIIGKKPRGFWRPKIKLSLWDDDPKLARELNIDPVFYLNQLPWANEAYRKCGSCQACKTAFPVRIYKEASARDNALVCPGKSLHYFVENVIEGYAEWRPGIPDYTDYFEKCRDYICNPAIAEYTRRIEEGLESPELDGTVFSESGSGHAHVTVNDTVKQTIRKLKIEK